MTFYEERYQFKNCNIGANNKHTSNAFGHCAFNHKIKLSYLRPATNTSLYFELNCIHLTVIFLLTTDILRNSKVFI